MTGRAGWWLMKKVSGVCGWQPGYGNLVEIVSWLYPVSSPWSRNWPS
jgi:hypothetical protein